MKVIKNTKNFKNLNNLYMTNRVEGGNNWNEREVKIVVDKIKEYNITPLEVGQKFKVLALHPKAGTLHTGTILTSNTTSAHVQFDREDLGV